MLLDGSHFQLANVGARRVGRKALAVNISDIAAMGGRIWARPRPEGGAEFGFALPELRE